MKSTDVLIASYFCHYTLER